MKTLFCRLFFFVIPIVLSLIVFEMMARELPNSYKYKELWMDTHAKDVEILICGPSHAYYDINPRYFKGYKTFNLANVSESLDYTYFMLSKDSSYYRNLKYVILTISYFTFPYKRLEKGPEWYRCINYKLYNGCKKHALLSKYSFELSHPETAIRKIKRFIKRDERLTCDSLGWACDYLLKDRKDVSAFYSYEDASKALLFHTSDDWSDDTYLYGFLEKIASFCNEKEIQLIIVIPPVWKTYYVNCNKKQLAHMYELINRVCRDYHVIFKDYFLDSRFEMDDFFDIHHLSDVGAEKFSKILYKDFIEN